MCSCAPTFRNDGTLSPSESLVGGTGLHTTLMPRDRYRINALYGHSTEVVNLAASPQIVEDDLEIHLGDPPAVTPVCRGDSVTVTFTLLNQSSGASLPLFRNRVRLSTEFNGHNGDGWTVADWDDSLATWQDKRIPVTFTVPHDFPLNQAGYIYVDVDWWAEVNAVPGTQIDVWQCDQRATQRWQFDNVRIYGLGRKCLEFKSGLSVNSTCVLNNVYEYTTNNMFKKKGTTSAWTSRQARWAAAAASRRATPRATPRSSSCSPAARS